MKDQLSFYQITAEQLEALPQRDFIVDREGVEETAKYFAVTPKFIDNAYHDCMLGPIWKHTAQTISWWLGDA